MQAIVLAELGVEGDRDDLPLPRRDGVAVDLGEDLDVRPVLGDPGRADEDRAQRPPVDAGELDVGLEAARSGVRRRCAARRCPSRPRCSRSSMISPAHEPSTGRPEAASSRSGSAEPLALDAERHRRRLAARDDSPSRPVEVRGPRAPRACRRRARRASARAPRSRPAARARRSGACASGRAGRGSSVARTQRAWRAQRASDAKGPGPLVTSHAGRAAAPRRASSSRG